MRGGVEVSGGDSPLRTTVANALGEFHFDEVEEGTREWHEVVRAVVDEDGRRQSLDAELRSAGRNRVLVNGHKCVVFR